MTTSVLDLTTQTPAEIDTALAEHWAEEQKWKMYLLSEASRVAAAERRLQYQPESGYEKRVVAEGTVRCDEYRSKMMAARALAAPLEAEFERRGGWLRYFLVTNTNGHVHRERDCSTCFETTEYAWLPALSDCDEAAMVAEYGEMACTICFPDAPSMKGFGDGTSTYARKTQAEKDQRAAEKAERDAKKFAKALQPRLQFKDHRGYRVETVAAAKQVIRDTTEVQVVAGTTGDYNDYYARNLGEAVEAFNLARHALLEKGVTEDEIATIIERATKKAKKEHNL